MKQLKRISLWRRIAIVLCFVLAIGAGVAGALIPHKDDAFAAADDYDKLEVTCIIDSLENNVSDDEYEQVKGFLVVRGSKNNVQLGTLKPDQYDLTVVYSTDEDTSKQFATINITWKENSKIKTSVTLPAIDAVARGLIVNVDTSKAGTLDSDGYYRLAENHYVFFTDMTAEAVLGYFNASVQYQHISKAIKKNADGNFESLGAGFTLRRLFINNNSFEVGAQNIEFTAIIEKGEGNNKETVTLTQTTSLKFMQRRVVSISASYTPKDLDGEGGNDTIYTYTNLKEYLNVTVTYNDGRKGEGISQGDYNVSTLFPNKKWTLENGSEVTINSSDKGSYAKNIVVTYGADTSISCTVQNAPRITYTRPYQFSSLTGTLSTQTVGKEFDFSGLTLTAIYFPGTTSGWFESSVTQVESMVIPLAELEDKSFMQIIYKNDDGEVIDSSAGLVPEGATNVEITFIYELNGKKIDAKKYGLVNQPDLSSSTMLITGGTANKQHRDNYIAYSSKISIENNSTETGTETYNKPVVDTLSKYLVDVEGKLQTVTLDYRLREALAEAADPTSVLSVSVSDLDGNKIENVWSANVADNSYGFIFNQAGFYHITFTLKNDVWETGSKTVSYDISVQKRQLKPSYVNDNSQVLVGDSLIGILNSLQIGFRNEDNDAAAKEYLPGYTLFMYTGSYSNAFQIGTGVAGGNPTINTASIPEDPGIYRVYITYEGNDYYYGGSSYPNNMLTVSIGDTRETNYARQNLTSLVEWWISQSGETAKLYTYNVYHYNEENVGGHFQGEEITDPTEILHAGLYAVKGTDAQGAPVWGVLVIRGLEYNPQPIESERTNIHYGDTTLSKADFVDDAKKILQNHNMYAELDPDNDFTFFAENGTRLSSVSNVGKYQARFKTKPATGETTADYNTPDIYVNFEIKPHIVKSLTLTTGESKTTVEYTGNEIVFNLRDNDGKWLDIYQDNLIVTMNDAKLVNGRTINSAFYFVHGTTDGTVRVAIAGTYKVSVTFNHNVVSEDGEDYKELTINVTQAKLTVAIADGKDQIEQEATNSVFALQANKLVFTGVGSDNSGTTASAGFRPSSYKVYATYSNGKLSDEQTNAVPYREAPYYLHLTGISANNYRYPVTSGGLLADFTYMENYTFDFGTAESPTAQAVFALKVQQQVLKSLERKDGEPNNTAVTEIFEAGRAWNMLDYFTTTEPISTYKITVTKAGTSETVAAIADGENAGKFNLNAGNYTVNIDTNGTNVWQNNGSGVTFALTVEKQEIAIENIGLIRDTFDGAEHSASLGGTSAYWSDLDSKGVKANVLYTAPGATGTDAKKPLADAFDIASGQFKYTNAGTYYITFSIPAGNYYWSGSNNAATDKTNFTAAGNYTTGEQTIAEIARMQITAPALGTARLTQTGTARTLPEALQYKATGLTLTQNGITITYNVEYATAGELQDASHTHESFSTSQPDDSKQGVYAIRLTITGNNATNFAWVRNDADVNYISYTNGYDIQGFNGKTDTDRAGAHVAILHYVTVTQPMSVTCEPSQSFYYGGYLGNSVVAMTDLAGHMFHYNGTIPEGNSKTYSYTKDDAEKTPVNANDFKSWDAGKYIGTVNITFSNTEFLPLSFNVAITVEKLPVALVLGGKEFYGADQGNYSPTVAYAKDSKHFLNADGTEIAEANIPVSFTTEIDKTTSAGTYGAEAFTLNSNAGGVDYSKNYNITYTASYEVTKAPITLTVGTGKSNYGATIDYYEMLGEITQLLRNGDKITDIVTASPNIPNNSYTGGRLNADGYKVDFEGKTDGNYIVTFSGNAYNYWTVEKIQAEVKIDISLFYGETVDTTKTAPATSNGIYTVTYSNMLDGDPATPAGVNGSATFTVSDGNVKYVSGLTSTNYFFEEVSQGTATGDSHGRVSYKPLDVTVAIDNKTSDYYQQKKLTYTLTVNSVSSYDADKKVALPQEDITKLGVTKSTDGTDGVYTGATWSRGVNADYQDLPFIITTGAYVFDNTVADNVEKVSGATANAGTYAIVGMVNPEFAENYDIKFSGEWANGSNAKKAGVYTVNPVSGGNNNIVITNDPNDAKDPENEDKFVIVITFPNGAQATTPQQPETRQAAPAKAETVKAQKTAAQKTTTRRATSLAKTVEESAEDAEPERAVSLAATAREGETTPTIQPQEVELTYNDKQQSLGRVTLPNVQDAYTVYYSVIDNPTDTSVAPLKTETDKWTLDPPTRLRAGVYKVYIWIHFASNNYTDTDVIHVATVTITAVSDNTVKTSFQFKDGGVYPDKASAIAHPAWVYGMYSDRATDGFNILGSHAITECAAKYEQNSIWNFKLYTVDGETETELLNVNTLTSATALFKYMFNNNAGIRFDAGVYKLVISQTSKSEDYNLVSESYYFSVAKRKVTVSAGSQSIVYGERFDVSSLTATVSGLVINNVGEDPIAASELYTVDLAEDANYIEGETEAGTTLRIVVTNKANKNYTVKGNEGLLTVVRRRVVITIGDNTATYGDTNPNRDYSYTVVTNQEDATTDTSGSKGYNVLRTELPYNAYLPLETHQIIVLGSTLPASLTTTTASEKIAGKYPIYAIWNKISESGTDTYEKNYEIVFVNCSYGEALNVTEAIGAGEANKAGTYTVNKKVIDVEWSASSGSSYVYNGKPREFEATGVVPGESTSVSLTISYEVEDGNSFKPLGENEKPINAATYKVSAEFKEADYPNYTTGGSSITITITKATATVTAKDASVVYGNGLDNDTGYGMTIAFPAGITTNTIDTDEKSALEAITSWKTDGKENFFVYTDRDGKVPYVAGKDVGSYQIVINTKNVSMTNFELVPVAGVFTVTKRDVTVEFKNNLETEYSGKYVTQAYINNTLVKNHEGEIFEVTSDWQPTHDWKALGIVLSVENALNAGNYDLTATNSSANYNISNIDQLNGTLTIKKKALTVSASATVVYGEDWDTAIITPVWNGFIEDLEDYESLQAIANAMGANAGNKPVTGNIGYTTTYKNEVGNNSSVGSTETVTPDIANLAFLNYTLTVDKTEGVNLVEVTPRTVTVAPHADYEYDPTGNYFELDEQGKPIEGSYCPVIFGNLFEGDKIVVSYKHTKGGTSVDGLGDAGTYSVTATLEEVTEGSLNEVNKNYRFKNGALTSEAVTVKVVAKAVDVSWGQGVIDLDTNPGAINYLIGYDSAIMKIANPGDSENLGDFKHSYFNESDGTTTVKNVGLTVYSDGRYGIAAEIGTYTLTLTLGNSNNYRWASSEEATYTITFSATSIKVTLEVTVPQNAVFGDNAEVNATVANGNVRDVTFTYYPISDKDTFNGLVGKISDGTIQLSDLQGIAFVTTMPKNAGDYIVRAYYKAQDNANKTAEKFAAFTISPLAVSAPVVHDGVTSLVYNGSAQVFEVTGFEKSFMTFTAPDGMVGTTVGNTVRFTATDAKTYKVMFELSDNNHVWAEGAQTTISFTVKKSAQTIDLNDVYTFAYGDEIQIAPTFKFATDEAVLLYYAYGNADNPQGESLGSTLPSSAGVYYVVVSDNGTDNYDGASKGAIIVVTKKEVKVSITVNVPYGQTVVAGDINYTLTGLVSGETENDYVTVNLAALASGLAFGEGAGIKNVGRYNPVFATAQTVINAYTGDTANGLVGFAKRGVADNYYFTADDNSIVIVNKLAVSVVIGNASGTFGSSPQFNSGITLRWADSVGNNNIPAADRNLQDADLMELLGVTASSFYCTANNSSDVGSYPIKVTRWSSDNYNVTFVDGTFEVLPANIFVEWTTGGGSYGAVTEPEITKLSVLLNGSLQDVTNTTFGQNAISKLSFLFTDTTGVQLFEAGQIPEKAGEYYVELVFAADGKIGQNYTLSLSSAAQRRFSIGKLVIEVEDVRVDYGDDGMKLTYKNGEAVVPTLVANEELNKYFEITRVDDAKTVGTYYMTLTLNDFTNVQWSIGRTAEYRLAFNVTKARNHIVGSIQMEGWTYGDEAKTPSVTLANDKDISDGVEIKPVFEYSANNGADWTTVVPTAAGSYLVRATANGTTNVDAFASPSATPFTIARKAIAKPQIEITMANNTFTGSVLLANVSGFDQSLMMFDYVGNFTVDGNSIALTALNAGTYTLTITLTNSNYMWADNDENLVYEQAWTVAPKRLEKPTEGKNSFVVNGGIITYLPENYDPETMAITGNEEGHGGTFKAEISIIDPANYVWDDGTVDAIQIEWTIVGINTVFKALMGVLGSIAGLAVVGGAAQFVLNKRKQKREAEMDGSEEQTGEESEGGKQA